MELFLDFTNAQPLTIMELVNSNPAIDPSISTRFRFVPSPKEVGQFSSADVVMMVQLPLLDVSGKAFATQPGAASTGAVLIRNQSFDQNPDINGANAQGKGWILERSTLPTNCQGFAVTGSRRAGGAIYYAFDGSSLFNEQKGVWTPIVSNIVNTRTFGPVFPNPYDSSVVFVLTSDLGVRVSRDGGGTCPADSRLNALLALGADDVNQISFNYDHPASVVVGTDSGRLFFSPAPRHLGRPHKLFANAVDSHSLCCYRLPILLYGHIWKGAMGIATLSVPSQGNSTAYCLTLDYCSCCALASLTL